MDSTSTAVTTIPDKSDTLGMSRETGLTLYIIAIVALVGVVLLMKPKKAR